MKILKDIAYRTHLCGEEHKNIVQNLANAHNKNYSSCHIAVSNKNFSHFMRTHSNHISIKSPLRCTKTLGVNIEQEMVLSKSNATDYQQMLLLYKQINKIASKSLVK